jgi:hypothetical protein
MRNMVRNAPSSGRRCGRHVACHHEQATPTLANLADRHHVLNVCPLYNLMLIQGEQRGMRSDVQDDVVGPVGQTSHLEL